MLWIVKAGHSTFPGHIVNNLEILTTIASNMQKTGSFAKKVLAWPIEF